MPSVRGRHAWFALALGLVIIANLGQFRLVDSHAPDHFQAIHRYDVGDILAIGHRDSAVFRQMYGPYLALAEIAPGSTVLVPRGTRLGRYEYVSRLYGYGEVAVVERVAGDAVARLLAPADGAAGEAGEPFDPTPFIVARGEGGDREPPWAVAADLDPPTAPEEFLPRSLAAGRQGDFPRHPREFVLLEWPRPAEGSDHPYQDLLLETALLPAGIRAELGR